MGTFNKQKRTEYHLITCDHPFMIDIGMNSFTLPDLIDWWNFKDGAGKYINREFFPKPSQEQDENESIGLAELIDPTPRYTGSYEFNAWRYEKFNAGNYIKYAILTDKTKDADTWEYYNNNPDISDSDKDPFTIGDLNLNSYTGKTFDRITRELEDFPALSEGITDNYPVVVSNLIAMNDFYNIRGFEDTEQDNASRKFLNDIRRSKNSGYISWSGVVPLFLNIFEGGQKCVTNEDFTFKLYLFDRKKPLDNTKSQAFPDITLATYAIGPDGTNQKGKQDGDSFAITDDAPDKKVGGKLKTTFRPYDGTFSAGSEQIYGIVTSDIIPATVFPEDMAQWAEGMDIEEYLKDAVNNQHIQIGSGAAIPIDMQNSNPFQWTPNYANPKGCRADSKEKVTVKVFNMSPRDFTRGETVLLTDRYSLWWIDPIASGAEPPVPLKKTVSQWQFTYHMTNQDYFFRFADPTAEENDNSVSYGNQEDDVDGGYKLNPKVVTCMEAEEALSRKYLAARYEEDYLAKYGENVKDTDSIEEKDAGKAWPGYAQVTNWDFMGTHLAGLREDNAGNNMGNALVLTQTDKNHRGEFLQEFNNYGVQGVGRFTAPFFGCTFPNGYLGGDETSKYVNLNSAVKEGDNFTGKGFYVTGHDIDQNQAFFNKNSYANKEPDNTGVFDPTNDYNNISTNISPYYFFERIYEEQEVADEPHCNIFSSKENFFHLPADIGVNGSFNADYGGPILSLNKVQEYITNSKISNWASPTKVYENFHDFWLDSGSFQWLFNIVDSETKQETNNPDNSTFDIRPRNPNRVEFRPLRDSVFAQFDPPQLIITGTPAGVDASGNPTPDTRVGDAHLPFPARALVAQGFNNYPAFDAAQPVTGIINISRYGGTAPLWGRKTKERLLANDGVDHPAGFNVPENSASVAAGSTRGLIFGLQVKLPPDPEDPNSSILDAYTKIANTLNSKDVGFHLNDNPFGLQGGFIMPFKYNPWYTEGPGLHLEWNKLNDGAWYQTLDTIYPNYITNNHYGATDNNKQRGAYGVIGAVCTSEMQAGVQFKTGNVLGQPHAFLSNVFYPSWGARQDLTYSDPNTTALFVKIYEAWPRDQTIFDARFYAVHHFNDGNRLQPQEVTEPPLDFKRRPWEVGYQFGEILTYGERNPLTQQLLRPDETLPFTFTYSDGTQQISEVQVHTYVDDDGVLRQPFPVSGIPVVHDKTITNVDTKIPSIFSNGTVDLEVTNEDRRPERATFEIESLFDYEDTGGVENKLLRTTLIHSEGAVIPENTSNYVIDGDVVKNLKTYIVDNFSDVDGYIYEDYLEKYQKYTPLVPTSLWNVDPNRRARLLPWIYRKHDIGFAYTSVGLLFNPGFIDFENVQPEQTLHDIIKAQIDKNIIVAESGAGYKVGNIFTVTGGTGSDVQMRISETGVDGSVAQLQWISEEESVAGNQVDRPLIGYGFLPTDFLSGEISGITPETTSNLKITPVGNSNRSFKAYFVAGYTNYEEFIDRKPQVVTEIKDAYRISAPNSKDGESGSVSWRDNQDVQIISLGAQPLVLGDGTAFVATPGGLQNTDHIVGTNTRSINLNYDREKSNPNVLKGTYSKYDMFFHFHCDTNHQWIESDGQPLTFENQVDMEIFPF